MDEDFKRRVVNSLRPEEEAEENLRLEDRANSYEAQEVRVCCAHAGSAGSAAARARAKLAPPFPPPITSRPCALASACLRFR